MTTLVEDMLLLARLHSGRPLAEEPVDLSHGVRGEWTAISTMP